ncbi:MAG: hypothetical protein HND48_11235 [Chloroflexi bacterium]|nr:hypothetical protein [Chloroflexota bacterium]
MLRASMDRLPWLARVFAQEEQPLRPTTVGGVTLPQPVIVAAGLVKGQGIRDRGRGAVRGGPFQCDPRLAIHSADVRAGRVRIVHAGAACG